jgi:hypothetical protein
MQLYQPCFVSLVVVCLVCLATLAIIRTAHIDTLKRQEHLVWLIDCNASLETTDQQLSELFDYAHSHYLTAVMNKGCKVCFNVGRARTFINSAKITAELPEIMFILIRSALHLKWTFKFYVVSKGKIAGPVNMMLSFRIP